MGWGKKVGIGCGALIAGVTVLVVVVFFLVRTLTAGPEQVVRDFLTAAAAGDYEKAHTAFSAPLKERQPFEAFTAAVKQNPSLFQVKDISFSERSIDTSGAKLTGTLTLDAGTEVPATFSLVKENDTWKFLSYSVGSKD